MRGGNICHNTPSTAHWQQGSGFTDSGSRSCGMGMQPVDLPGFFASLRSYFSMPAQDPSAWVVHKCGGSSVADAECFKRVANILETLPPGPLGVVLSACRGVTDGLLGLVARAEAQDDAWRGDLDAIRARHDTIAEALLTPEARQLYMAGFDRDKHDIEGILHTVKLTRSAAQNVRDLIAGYGEVRHR